MASRGRKPTAAVLKLVTGNPGKRAIPEDVPEAGGEPVRPSYLKGRAADLWDATLPLLWWLGEVDSHKLGLWCALQAEFERSPKKMVAGRIAQLRALGSELGMDPASRTRLGGKGNGKPEPKTPADKYF